MTDDKEQDNEWGLRDFLFELPFIANGSESPVDWEEEQVELFKNKIIAACNEIMDDTTPVNSPAGKYRAETYEEFKRGLLKAVETYKEGGNKNINRVYSICRWALSELGWNKKVDTDNEYLEPWDQLDKKVQNQIIAFISGKSQKYQPYYKFLLTIFELNRDSLEKKDNTAAVRLAERYDGYKKIEDEPKTIKPKREIVRDYKAETPKSSF